MHQVIDAMALLGGQLCREPHFSQNCDDCVNGVVNPSLCVLAQDLATERRLDGGGTGRVSESGTGGARWQRTHTQKVKAYLATMRVDTDQDADDPHSALQHGKELQRSQGDEASETIEREA